MEYAPGFLCTRLLHEVPSQTWAAARIAWLQVAAVVATEEWPRGAGEAAVARKPPIQPYGPFNSAPR
jgi:hypothetical protein